MTTQTDGWVEVSFKVRRFDGRPLGLEAQNVDSMWFLVAGALMDLVTDTPASALIFDDLRAREVSDAETA